MPCNLEAAPEYCENQGSKAGAKKRLRAERTFQPGSVLSDAPQSKGHGNGTQLGWSRGLAGPQSFEVRKSGDRGGGHRYHIPQPLKTPRAGRLPSLTSFPSPTPAPSLLPGRKGLPVPQQQGKGGKEAGQVLQSTAPGSVRGQEPLTTGWGEKSAGAVFRNLPAEESRLREARRRPAVAEVAGLQAPA